MAIYTEKVIDKKTGQKIDKLVDGKKQYYIRTYVNDENGNKKQITRHNKEWLGRDGYWEAKQEENRLRNAKIQNKIISFWELCNCYLEEQKQINKESTYYTYYKLINRWVIPFFPNEQTNEISTDDCLKYRKIICDKSLSLAMKNKCHIIVSSILGYGVKFGYVEKNFEQLLGPFKEKNEKVDNSSLRYITYEQFKIFIKGVDDIMWKTFFTFLFYTGMRKGEVQALSWEDIDFKNKQIIVTKNLTTKTFDSPYKITNTKTKENRKIDMSDYLVKQLKLYYKKQSTKPDFKIDDFVFGGKSPLSRTTIDRYKHLYFSKVDFNEITIHEFRHSHVSLIINEAVKQNLDMLGIFVMLSERMGHTIEVMQQTYMHLFPNIQNKVINILDNLDNKN